VRATYRREQGHEQEGAEVIRLFLQDLGDALSR